MGVQRHAGERGASAARRDPGAYPLARPDNLSLVSFAGRAGVHPDLVRRFVALGLLDAARDGAGQLWFTPAQLLTVARIQRLHTCLPVNYAAIGVILDLLDQIDSLETALRGTRRRYPPGIGGDS